MTPPPPPPHSDPFPPPPPLSSFNNDDLSIFHPSRHEGLPLQPDPKPPQLIPLSDDTDSCARRELPVEEEWLHRWRRRAKCLILFVRMKIRSRRGGGGMRFWQLAAFVGVLGAFLYARRRHQREKAAFLSLLREKDQKITFLLQQIARMNQRITARQTDSFS